MADRHSTPQPPNTGQPPEPEPMTRERAIELLRTDVKAWNKWREENSGEELPDLGMADRRGARLERVNLRGARLERVNLRGAHLEAAKLQDARLEEANLTGAHLQRADLRDAHLEEADLCHAHLNGANLNGAHLEGADLSDARLEGATLCHAHFQRADLSSAHFERADLCDAHLEGADMYGAHLNGANLNGAYLEGADLRGADFSNAELTHVTYDRERGKFRGIRVATCFGHALFVRDARDQDYIETFRAQSRWHARLCLLWSFTTDCGRSLLRVGLIGVTLALLFGCVYALFPTLLDMSASAQTGWTPYYYSIVTFTTLGFGDVTPATLGGEVLVTIEVILGYVTLGLLVSILANMVARRA